MAEVAAAATITTSVAAAPTPTYDNMMVKMEEKATMSTYTEEKVIETFASLVYIVYTINYIFVYLDIFPRVYWLAGLCDDLHLRS